MSLHIAVYRSGRFSHFLKRKKAERKVASQAYRWRDDQQSIEEVRLELTLVIVQAWIDGPLGIGNVLPFTRIQHPMRHPDKVNYPIPALGARSRPMHLKEINKEFMAEVSDLGAEVSA